MNYADDYTADQGLKVYKFEKDFGQGKSIGQGIILNGVQQVNGLVYNFIDHFR